MEEILASIRRIISDDGEGPEAPQPEAKGGALEDHDPAGEADVAGEDEAATDADMAAMVEDAAAEAETEDEPAAEEDVFELTEDMAANEVPAAEDEIDFDSLVEDEADDGDHEPGGMEDEVTFADARRQPPGAGAAPQTAGKAAEGLLSREAQATASAAFGALASTMLSHSGGARTLEQIVEDLLKPLLKAWLDEQLPPLVERLVREEIERVARRGG